MRLGARIVLFVTLTSILPLVVLAWAVSGVARDQVAATILSSEVTLARSYAEMIGRQVADAQRVLRLQVSNFRLDAAPDEARTAFLIATYRIFPEISIAVLTDAEGDEIVPPVYQPLGQPAEIPGHDLVSDRRLARFRGELPTTGDPAQQVWIGRAYHPSDARYAVLPVRIASNWADDPTAVGVELSLAPVAARLPVGENREVVLMTTEGEELFRTGTAGLLEPLRFKPLLASAEAGLRYRSNWGTDVLAASVRVPGYDWVVAVAEPAEEEKAGFEAIRARAGYIGGFAVFFAVVAGVLLTRAITGPIFRIRDAAIAVGEGDFHLRVQEPGRDELAELAAAFNRMSASLEKNASEIAAKNAEIEAFNRELQERVEQRTAQLREAQSRLVQSGQLAAVAEMSAGLAHELNNPLAGILGLIQLSTLKATGRPEEALLRSAEKEALRCKEIVANLLRFTRSDATEEGVSRDVVDLGGVVQDVLALMGASLRQRGIDVEFVPAREPLTVRGDPSLLGRALGQLLTSMRSVAAQGATLRIAGARRRNEVEFRFELGATTAETDDWRAAGMGFWVARQVFQEHAATLEEPEGDRGGPRIWRLRAPRAEPAA